MPCLSLRHHVTFARLCRWVNSARLAEPASSDETQASLVAGKDLEPEETAVQNSTVQDFELQNPTAQNLETQEVANQDSATQTSTLQISDGTLHIDHSRTPLFASSLLSDHSLADLVDAKLKALAAPEVMTELTTEPTAESIAEPATQLAFDPTITNPVEAENDKNIANAEDLKDGASTESAENTENSANIASVVNIATPKSAFRLPFAHFFSRSARSAAPRRLSQSELLNAESRLGSTIFGPIPAGHRREFFHDKQNIWIWHESWQAADSSERQITVRYEVRPTGIYKKFAAGKYVKLENAELDNFRRAAHAYLKVVRAGLYTPNLEVLQ